MPALRSGDGRADPYPPLRLRGLPSVAVSMADDPECRIIRGIANSTLRMCYSLAVLSPKEMIHARFDVTIPEGEQHSQYYYVSAFDYPRLPVITSSEPEVLSYFAWGLIPSWVKSVEDAERIRKQTMNARAESIYEKPAYRRAAASQHCLVIADGFFEWREVGGKKYPYFLRLKSHEPFALAGLWDSWTNQQSKRTILTFSIVTCPASPLLAVIHNTAKRMPVILPKDVERRWIDPKLGQAEACRLLTAFPDDQLEAFTVAKIVPGKGEANSPVSITPHRYPELGASSDGQASLF
jgi:putative SOS response-associated peptidase YedK